MIAKGGSSASKIYLGSTEVSKIYKGDTLVYGGTSPVLPYDAEVEYLETDKTSYIDTLIAPASLTSPIMEGVFYKIRPSSAYYICGSDAANPGRFSFAFTANTNAIEMRLGNYKDYTGYADGWHTLKISCVDNGMYIDGVKKGSASGVGTDSQRSTYSILLFTSRSASGNIYTQYTNIRCSSFKLWSNNTLIMDMIPVRKNGVGYMYDKVSGELFGNAAASGAFTYGADVSS